MAQHTFNHIQSIIVYTDGSCHTQKRNGAWAAILFTGNKKVILKDVEQNTTHNRMELTGVIKAIKYANENFPETPIEIFTDSQYVFDLPVRKDKLKARQFITKQGNELPNVDLLQQLITLIEKSPVSFHKVKAHEKTPGTENYNKEADMLCRELVRSSRQI